MESCPDCGRPYGKIRRCYVCRPARPRVPLPERICVLCGRVYQSRRRASRFCSTACRDNDRALRPAHNARPDEDIVLPPGGYVWAYAPHHPRASRPGRVMRHILVAEEMLGRALRPDERVHHRDHDRTNNDPSNLVVMSNAEHSALHALERNIEVRARRVTIACAICGQTVSVKPYAGHTANPRHRRMYCSRACQAKGAAEKTRLRHQARRERKAAAES